MPLIHAADERIDVRDVAFAAEFFARPRAFFLGTRLPVGSSAPGVAQPPERRQGPSFFNRV